MSYRRLAISNLFSFTLYKRKKKQNTIKAEKKMTFSHYKKNSYKSLGDLTDNRFRRLPVGIQSFKIIREENYLYVDKRKVIGLGIELDKEGKGLLDRKKAE